MNPKPWFLMLTLAFALLVQNTCPFGAAGKTALAATSCGDCPLRHNVVVSYNGQNALLTDSAVHFPHYIFEAFALLRSAQISPIASERPTLANNYKDALPDELLRPPRS